MRVPLSTADRRGHRVLPAASEDSFRRPPSRRRTIGEGVGLLPRIQRQDSLMAEPDCSLLRHGQALCSQSVHQPTYGKACTAIRRGWLSHPALCGIMALLLCCFAAPVRADLFDDSPPEWERLLWGGKTPSVDDPGAGQAAPRSEVVGTATQQAPSARSSELDPAGSAPPADEVQDSTRVGDRTAHEDLRADQPAYPRRGPAQEIRLDNIPPLYMSPVLPGEGIWQSQDVPVGPDRKPVMYKTSYRPSIEYPNAVVHMVLFDMSRLSMKLYIGSSEPGGSKQTAVIEPDKKPFLVAITNALWKQKHSGEAGTIHGGTVIKELAPGMATLAVYRDDSVDILEWNEGIPASLVRDARQLRHLIVKDGKVVDTVIRAGRIAESEIGLGFLLAEEQTDNNYAGWYGYSSWQSETNYGPDWFIASRSAFGIRPDGNLVFAVGHHISTKDLAKAMVLAGCERAIHGDANPHNVLGNIYYPGPGGTIAHKEKLSPEQKGATLDRYVEKSYTSDFFGFFLRDGERSSL
jgi:hypothetical protein